MTAEQLVVSRADAVDPEVAALLEALTVELASAGYTAEQTFGYSADRLAASGVHLVGARRARSLVGVAGIEPQGDGLAELKRFYVLPAERGTGVADALIAALLDHARDLGVTAVRLETGDRQHRALRFYRRHGFTEIPRFGPYAGSETSVCMERRADS